MLHNQKSFRCEYQKLDDTIERVTGCSGIDAQFISRREATIAGVPSTFVPSATRFLVTDAQLLSYLAHPNSIYGAERRSRWCGDTRKGFIAVTFDGYCFHLTEYGDRKAGYGQLWAVSRTGRGDDDIWIDEVLAINSAPIFFNDIRMAKGIAILCHPKPRKEARCLHWMPSGLEEQHSDSQQGEMHDSVAG